MSTITITESIPYTLNVPPPTHPHTQLLPRCLMPSSGRLCNGQTPSTEMGTKESAFQGKEREGGGKDTEDLLNLSPGTKLQVKD